MTKTDINAFIKALESKNSWGKNEVIDLFREWVIDVLLREEFGMKEEQ